MYPKSLEDFSDCVDPLRGNVKQADFRNAAFRLWEVWMRQNEEELRQSPMVGPAIQSLQHADRLFQPGPGEVDILASVVLETHCDELR